MPRQEEFREQLSSYVIDYVIEKSLNEVFGETSTRLIYDYLERKHHLRRKDIPENLEAFFSAVDELYGFGAIFLERRVLNKLYSKMGLEFKEREGYSFSDYIGELKTPKRLKADEKAIIRLEHLDIAALTSLPDHLRTTVLAKLKSGNITPSDVIKEIKRTGVTGERPIKPAGRDRGT